MPRPLSSSTAASMPSTCEVEDRVGGRRVVRLRVDQRRVALAGELPAISRPFSSVTVEAQRVRRRSRARLSTSVTAKPLNAVSWQACYLDPLVASNSSRSPAPAGRSSRMSRTARAGRAAGPASGVLPASGLLGGARHESVHLGDPVARGRSARRARTGGTPARPRPSCRRRAPAARSRAPAAAPAPRARQRPPARKIRIESSAAEPGGERRHRDARPRRASPSTVVDVVPLPWRPCSAPRVAQIRVAERAQRRLLALLGHALLDRLARALERAVHRRRASSRARPPPRAPRSRAPRAG